MRTKAWHFRFRFRVEDLGFKVYGLGFIRFKI